MSSSNQIDPSKLSFTSPLAVTQGGTGATTASAALAALGASPSSLLLDLQSADWSGTGDWVATTGQAFTAGSAVTKSGNYNSFPGADGNSRFTAQAPIVIPASSNYTVIGWVYSNDLTTWGSSYIVDGYTGPGASGILHTVGPGSSDNFASYYSLASDTLDGRVTTQTNTPTPITGTWYMFAAVFDRVNSVYRIFVNDQFGVFAMRTVATTIGGNQALGENENIVIGARAAALNNIAAWNGLIGAVKIYTEALTASQLTEEFNTTKSTYGYPLAISQGGTGATTASAARLSLGVAASGANTDITSLTQSSKVVDISNALLKRSTSVISIDWENSQLKGNGGQIVVAWTLQQLKDQFAVLGLDWGDDRTLNNASGAVVLDWKNYLIKRSSGSTAIDWQNNYLRGTGGDVNLDWGATNLQDANVIVLDWNQQELYTDAHVLTLQWQSRNLVGDWAASTGNLAVSTAGKGLRVKEGSNAKQGTSTLVGGTVTVSNTSVTASSRIVYSVSTPGGVQGFLSTTQSAGVSFTVNSTSVADTSTVVWEIFEPA